MAAISLFMNLEVALLSRVILLSTFLDTLKCHSSFNLFGYFKGGEERLGRDEADLLPDTGQS